eukprot:s447_g11.t1
MLHCGDFGSLASSAEADKLRRARDLYEPKPPSSAMRDWTESLSHQTQDTTKNSYNENTYPGNVICHPHFWPHKMPMFSKETKDSASHL